MLARHTFLHLTRFCWVPLAWPSESTLTASYHGAYQHSGSEGLLPEELKRCTSCRSTCYFPRIVQEELHTMPCLWLSSRLLPGPIVNDLSRICITERACMCVCVTETSSTYIHTYRLLSLGFFTPTTFSGIRLW